MAQTAPTTQTRLVAELRPHPLQPRLKIDAKDPEFQKLVRSVKTKGIIEPLVITPKNEIIAGLRRQEAARMAGLKEVPIHIRELRKGESIEEVMYDENSRRQSLSLFEEALSLEAIRKRRKFTGSKLARHLGESTQSINCRLAIVSLETDVQQMYHRNQLPLGAAPVLASVRSAERQVELAVMLREQQISLEDLRTTVESAGKKKRKQVQQPQAKSGTTTAKADQPKRAGKQQIHAAHDAPEITRSSARAALSRNLGGKISLHTVSVLFEQTCSNCTLIPEGSICTRSCPVPRLITAIAGRAS